MKGAFAEPEGGSVIFHFIREGSGISEGRLLDDVGFFAIEMEFFRECFESRLVRNRKGFEQ